MLICVAVPHRWKRGRVDFIFKGGWMRDMTLTVSLALIENQKCYFFFSEFFFLFSFFDLLLFRDFKFEFKNEFRSYLCFTISLGVESYECRWKWGYKGLKIELIFAVVFKLFIWLCCFDVSLSHTKYDVKRWARSDIRPMINASYFSFFFSSFFLLWLVIFMSLWVMRWKCNLWKVGNNYKCELFGFFLWLGLII